MKFFRFPLRGTASALVLAQILVGCAGGGGGGTVGQPPRVTPPVTPPASAPPVTGLTAASYRTSEYRASYSLEAVHAAEAYAQGYTGQGVTIGVFDFNFSLDSTEVRYSADSRGASSFAKSLYEAQTGEEAPEDTHGNAVAAVAAAIKNGSGTHGVAFNATILAVDYFSRVNESQIVQGGTRYYVSDPWAHMRSHGVRIINMSIGYDTDGATPGPPGVSEIYLTEVPAVAVDDGALLVTSAGNNSSANPSLSNLAIIDDLTSNNLLNGPGAFIIAGAVDRNNVITSYSNRAGVAKDFYMVAPADEIVGPWNGSLFLLSGTSFAAPMISGAAALLLQKWPTLTAKQVADILFTSATDLGAPGVDAVYGHGLLNVNAALQPIGTTTVPTGSALGSVSTMSPSVSATGVMLGSAFGDAPAFRTALSGIMILDSFSRDFRFDASTLAWSRSSQTRLSALVHQRFGWRGAALPIGEASALSFDVRNDPWAGFRTLGGTDVAAPSTVVQFFGSGAGFDWNAGTGLSLHDALASRQDPSRFTASALTRAFSSVLDAEPLVFATARIALLDDTGLSIGFSQAKDTGIAGHPVAGLREHSAVSAAALRFDHEEDASQLALEFGGFTEEGALLGSLSAGGLQLTERSATTWITASAETALGTNWSLKAAFTLAKTDAGHASGTLVASFGSIVSSGFSFGLMGRDLFRDHDALTVTLHQPTRAEHASVTLMSGVGRDPITGAVIMGETRSSLVPSGREIALETGYRVAWGEWSAEANLAYRHDAGHHAGLKQVDAIFFLSRSF